MSVYLKSGSSIILLSPKASNFLLKPGQLISINYATALSGLLTSSKHVIEFIMQLPGILTDEVHSVAFKELKLVCRQRNNYIIGSSDTYTLLITDYKTLSSYLTVTCNDFGGSFIYPKLTWSSNVDLAGAEGAVNNSDVAINYSAELLLLNN